MTNLSRLRPCRWIYKTLPSHKAGGDRTWWSSLSAAGSSFRLLPRGVMRIVSMGSNYFWRDSASILSVQTSSASNGTKKTRQNILLISYSSGHNSHELSDKEAPAVLPSPSDLASTSVLLSPLSSSPTEKPRNFRNYHQSHRLQSMTCCNVVCGR